MNIAKQLQGLRNAHHISQDELADIIHVSRQTISSWENERSYPDIQSLLLLSDYYKVSLDELVKGDIMIMKEKLTMKKMNTLGYGMILFFIIMILSFIPILVFDNPLCYIPTAIGAIGLFLCAFKAEQIKKDKNIQTYKEVVNYMEHGELPGEDYVRSQKKLWLERVGYAIISAAITIVLLAIIFWLFK